LSAIFSDRFHNHSKLTLGPETNLLVARLITPLGLIKTHELPLFHSVSANVMKSSMDTGTKLF